MYWQERGWESAINLKNGEVGIGLLEANIEIQVQKEPEVKITGVSFVDKFVKA
ncbi:hypothetical protein FACS189472_17270 [Alphaproteobacteria bacterium]|nr:hypothetical protein FACS189472_17270 [Alphaproteobacteria bacterium]